MAMKMMGEAYVSVKYIYSALLKTSTNVWDVTIFGLKGRSLAASIHYYEIF